MKFRIRSTKYYLDHFLGVSSNPCDACKVCPREILLGKAPCPVLDAWYLKNKVQKEENNETVDISS